MMVSDFSFPDLDFTVPGYVLETPVMLTLPSPETRWDGRALLPPQGGQQKNGQQTVVGPSGAD